MGGVPLAGALVALLLSSDIGFDAREEERKGRRLEDFETGSVSLSAALLWVPCPF